MTRIVLIVIAVCLILGAMYFQEFNSKPQGKLRLNVAFATKDIPNGEKFTLGDVDREFIPAEKAPRDPVYEPKGWVGMKLRNRVRKGQFLSSWDFENTVHAVFRSSEFISKNQIVEKSDFKLVWKNDDPRDRHYKKIIKRPDTVIGKRAKRDIPAGKYLFDDQFE